MKKLLRLRVCATLGFLALEACYVPIEMGRQMQADLRALREEIHATRRTCDSGLAAAAVRADSVDVRLAQAALSLDALGKGTQTAGAGLGSQLEQVMRAIDELRGTVEVTEHRVALTETQLSAAQKARAEAEEARAAEARAREESKKRAPRKKADLLAEGQKRTKARDFSGARKVWRELFESAPGEAGSADEALVRIGDSFFQEKQWENALNEYVRLLDGFPKSVHAEQAYLQVGLCSAALGRNEDAITFLTEVVKKAPKSDRAKIAQNKLSEILAKQAAPAARTRPEAPVAQPKAPKSPQKSP